MFSQIILLLTLLGYKGQVLERKKVHFCEHFSLPYEHTLETNLIFSQ